MGIGVYLHLTERHEHEHGHELLEHEHSHFHDSHHQHEHGPEDSPVEPHVHWHRHSPMIHRHPHYPDIHLDSGYAPTAVYGTVIASLCEAAKNVLAAAKAVAREQGVVVEAEIIEHIGGRAAEIIVQVARQWSADLIVMGTHGRRGLRRLALGSDVACAVQVLRYSSRFPRF